LRAARNDPDEAARQLRSLVGAALHVTASGFDLADLVNTDPAKVQLESFEARLRAQLAPQLRAVYGIELRQFGIERLSLPEETMAATVGRMRAERETVAAARAAEGLRQAAGIRAEADRQSKELLAAARTEAAGIEASAQAKAAQIQAEAYQGDPALYDMLRSLDAITLMVNSNTRLILRGDSPPFKTLTEGPAP
jgi:membrane protease subunit HflC